MNRSFLMLLGLAIFLGAGFGGSFVGGIIYGQGRAEAAAANLSPRLGAGGQGFGGAPIAGAERQGTGGGQGGVSAATDQGGNPGSLRRGGGQDAGPQGQAQAGQEQFGASLPDTPSSGSGAGGETVDGLTGAGRRGADAASTPAGRGVLGTVQQLDGDTLTAFSPRGEVTVTLSETTMIYQMSPSTRESLASNVRVWATGEAIANGQLEARSVLVLPEGMEELFPAGPGGSGRRSTGQGAP